MIAALTWINTRGLRLGKWIQNVFTSAKTLSLVALIVLGVVVGRNAQVVAANFAAAFATRDPETIRPDLAFMPAVSAASGLFGVIVAYCTAQVGSLFSADAWNNITFTAGGGRCTRRHRPPPLGPGTSAWVSLDLLARV